MIKSSSLKPSVKTLSWGAAAVLYMAAATGAHAQEQPQTGQAEGQHGCEMHHHRQHLMGEGQAPRPPMPMGASGALGEHHRHHPHHPCEGASSVAPE